MEFSPLVIFLYSNFYCAKTFNRHVLHYSLSQDVYRPAPVAQWRACRTHDLVVVSRDPVEAIFLSGVFSPLTSAEAREKSSQWFWKEICVSTGVRKLGNICVTDHHDMTLAVTVALKLNTTNQFSKQHENAYAVMGFP